MGETGEKIKKAAPNVFLALVAVTAAACEKVNLKDGDLGTIVKQTTCWKDPGGKDASRLEAPTGQEDHGLIHEGAEAVVAVDEETEVFGATTNLATWIRVKINGQDITPSRGVIAGMAAEQGIAPVSVSQPENQVCWIKSTDFSPANK